MKFPDLNEHGTPKGKLQDCPGCGEDELAVLNPQTLFCYRCYREWWKQPDGTAKIVWDPDWRPRRPSGCLDE